MWPPFNRPSVARVAIESCSAVAVAASIYPPQLFDLTCVGESQDGVTEVADGSGVTRESPAAPRHWLNGAAHTRELVGPGAFRAFAFRALSERGAPNGSLSGYFAEGSPR
jgi:hypothetical protein